jgi:hypothetical protein
MGNYGVFSVSSASSVVKNILLTIPAVYQKHCGTLSTYNYKSIGERIRIREKGMQLAPKHHHKGGDWVNSDSYQGILPLDQPDSYLLGNFETSLFILVNATGESRNRGHRIT